MDGAGILAEGDVLGAVPAVLDPPMAALEREQACRVGDGGRQAGDALGHLAVRDAARPPRPLRLAAGLPVLRAGLHAATGLA